MAAYMRFLMLFLYVLPAIVMGVAVQEKVEEGRDAQQLAVMAYVINMGDNTISVIDTVTHKMTATISVKVTNRGYVVNYIVFTPNGAQAYVIYMGDVDNGKNGTVSVINTAMNQVTTTVPVGIGPVMLNITPNGAQVYVVNVLSHDVTVIDTLTNKVIATISVGTFPYEVSFVTVPTSTEAKTSVINKMTN